MDVMFAGVYVYDCILYIITIFQKLIVFLFVLLDDWLTKPDVPFYRAWASQYVRDTWKLRRDQKLLRSSAGRSRCT